MFNPHLSANKNSTILLTVRESSSVSERTFSPWRRPGPGSVWSTLPLMALGDTLMAPGSSLTLTGRTWHHPGALFYKLSWFEVYDTCDLRHPKHRTVRHQGVGAAHPRQQRRGARRHSPTWGDDLVRERPSSSRQAGCIARRLLWQPLHSLQTNTSLVFATGRGKRSCSRCWSDNDPIFFSDG